MGRPVKWSRDLHSIRERAAHARTETWGRVDIEGIFGVGRATAQTLMKAIGEVQPGFGLGYVFPIDSGAREKLHWGVIVSLIFEF